MDENRAELEVCEVEEVDEQCVARARERLPHVAPVAELFKVLADETRTSVLCALMGEEMCVCDLARLLGQSVSNVSHHLRILRGAHLVRTRRDGKRVIYALDDDHVVSLIKAGVEHAGHTTR